MRNGSVVRLNPAGERLLGMAAADALGRTCGDVLGCDVVRRARSGGLPTRRGDGDRPADRLPRDGRPRAPTAARSGWPAATRPSPSPRPTPATPRARPGRPRSCATSARVRALEELREGFVATVSHELRTPLSLIRGYTETLLHLDLTPEEQRDYLGRIDEVTGRLSALVGQILDVTHLQADPLILERAPVLFVSLVNRLRGDLETTGRADRLVVGPAGRPAATRRGRAAGRPDPREPRRQRLQVRAAGRPGDDPGRAPTASG